MVAKAIVETYTFSCAMVDKATVGTYTFSCGAVVATATVKIYYRGLGFNALSAVAVISERRPLCVSSVAESPVAWALSRDHR